MNKEKTVTLFEVSKPTNNYLILESFVEDFTAPHLLGGFFGGLPQNLAVHKNLHVVNF
jgi:hypothetical protein